MSAMGSHKGKYRIQTVAEMTGVTAATLRAWERRYGIPVPERSDSSYRLFSDHDVAAIRRLKELCDAGMAPAEAAKLIPRIEEASNKPVEGDPYWRACEAILRAIHDFDPHALEHALRGALFLGSATTVYTRVLAPVMREVGDAWHEGTISIAQEHMAAEKLGASARDMLRLLDPMPDARPAVVACFADEEHTLPLYGVALTLVPAGFDPLVLGARTPPSAIRHAVESIQPALVALSVTLAPPAFRSRELVDEYAEAVGDVPWIIGGAGSEALRDSVEHAGGMVVAGRNLTTDLRAALERLRERPSSTKTGKSMPKRPRVP
jgi:DNA-binding transcriptional MerR regulator